MGEIHVASWCKTYRWQLGWLIVGAALTGWGTYEWLTGQTTAHRASVNVADIEAGQRLPSRWVEITGRVSRADRVIWPNGQFEETYAPVVSEHWQPGKPIHVLFRAIKEVDSPEDAPGRLLHHKEPTLEGVVVGGLPPEVRHRFELADHQPAADAIVVDYQARPDHQDLAIGYVCVPAGLLIVLVTGLIWFSQRQAGTSFVPASGPAV